MMLYGIGHNPLLNGIAASLMDGLTVIVILMAIGSLIGAAYLRWR
jgi:hypothetical protein